MLQQTQVERVIPYFRAWLKQFPTVSTLAKAPLSKVLQHWQGLGYNRRAKMLHDSAKMVEAQYRGRMPTELTDLERLRGVGPYTARAVMAFAYNIDVVFVETNIRTAVFHHFFQQKNISIYGNISDVEILKTVEQTLSKGRAREWYSALMDYGAYLKRSGIKLNARAKGYTKQSTFKGSDREARGAIIKALTQQSRTKTFLLSMLGTKRRTQTEQQLQTLEKERLIGRARNRNYCLPS